MIIRKYTYRTNVLHESGPAYPAETKCYQYLCLHIIKCRVEINYYSRVEPKTKFYDTLKEIHNVAHNRPYDVMPLDWVKAYFKDYDSKNTQNKQDFFH